MMYSGLLVRNMIGWVGVLASVIALSVITIGSPARAHEISAAVMDVEFGDDPAQLNAEIELNLEAFVAGIGTEHDDTEDSPEAAIYNRYRALTPDELAASFAPLADEFAATITVISGDIRLPVQIGVPNIPAIDDVKEVRLSRIAITAELPPNTEAVQIGWASQMGEIIVRTAGAGDGSYAALLSGGELSAPLSVMGPTAQGFWATLVDFIGTGFDHIIPKGLDHILFVVGLFLLSTAIRPLLWQISAFTLAHTITLALGMLGIVNISGAIVEPIIAASIVYVAVENILSPQMTRWRPLLVFGFGLLHGLGFAGVLTEFGLPQGAFLAGLIGFNIGVELGQLAVIAICFLLVGFWFGNKPWYRRVVVIPGSVIVAAIGTWWVIERTLL